MWWIPCAEPAEPVVGQILVLVAVTGINRAEEVVLEKEKVWQTHLSKAAFTNDFEVVKIIGFDPNVEKQSDDQDFYWLVCF